MSYILAILILTVWLFLVINLAWIPKANFFLNLLFGIFVFFFMGFFYLIPFWLICF